MDTCAFRFLMKQFFPYVFILTLAGVLSCKDDESISTDEQEEQLITGYLDSLGVLESVGQDESGLYYYPITLNPSGKTQSSGNVLSIHYRLEVLGGQVIDILDSLDQDTLVVKQGANAIYPVGLDGALEYLKEGETWGFVLPSDIAYGDFTYSTLIPEKAIILAELTLLKIRTEDEVLEDELEAISQYVDEAELRDTVNHPLNMPENLGSGMVYKRLVAGTGERPEAGQTVTITYESRDLEEVVLDRAAAAAPFEYLYNEGIVIPGLDAGIGRMQAGETALLIMPSYLGYRESAQVIPGFLTADMVEMEIVPAYAEKVGPYEPLIFEVKLVEIN